MAQFYSAPSAVHALRNFSGLGMSLFFVLSGFVIHYSYRTSIQQPYGFYNFIVARFARLYPLYIVLICVELVLIYRTYEWMNVGFKVRTFGFYITLTQTWTYGLFRDASIPYQFGPIAQISWSISTEWGLYLAYPLLLWGMLRLKTPAATIFVWSAHILLALAVFALAYAHHDSISEFMGYVFGEIADGRGASAQDSFFRWLIYFSPYSRIFEFVVGCLAAHLYVQREDGNAGAKQSRFGLLLTAMAISGVVLTYTLLFMPGVLPVVLPAWTKPLQSTFGLAPSCGLLIFCCARYQNILTKPFTWRPIVTLGDASYSIYLLHMAFFSFFLQPPVEASGANVALRLTYLAGVIALLFGTSLILFRVLEMPARRLIRRHLSIVPTTRPGIVRSVIVRGAYAVLGFSVLAAFATLAIPLARNFEHARQSIQAKDAAPADGTIDIIAATYGASCVKVDGNATYSARRNCNGKTACDYAVSVAVIGDPAPGCSKDFRVDWRCSSAGITRSVSLPGEAGLRSIARLTCPQSAPG
jgi:peptidoglycan/LPS O-acetylase OafA/YrhL